MGTEPASCCAPPRPPPAAWAAAAALGLLAAGTALRLYRLGQPALWGDEILYLRMSRPPLSTADVVRSHLRTYRYAGHLPASALLTLWGLRCQGARGRGEVDPHAARLPTAAVGALTTLLLAAWVGRLSGRLQSGLLALAVSTFSYVHIWYSREAYYYAGQIAYAVLALLCVDALASRRPARRTAAPWCALLILSAWALAFSHPTGSTLLAVAALHTLAVALWKDRSRVSPYAVSAVLALSVFSVVLIAGVSENRTPYVSVYRYPFWTVALDLLETFGLGPGLWRRLASASLLLAGAAAVARTRNDRVRWLLLAVPALFLLIHLGGRRTAYRSRYFLLMWPFVVWLLTAGLDALLNRVPARRRPAAFLGLCLLLAAQVAPGLKGLYALRGKRDQIKPLRDVMDRELADGTLCLWDVSHAAQFIPRFYTPRTTLLFSAFGAVPPGAYLDGTLERYLRNLREAFPLCAYIEWSGMNTYLARRVAGPARSPASFRREIAALFGAHRAIGDPALDRLMRSRWYPPGVPLLADDYAERLQAESDFAVLHLYFATPASLSDPAYPIPDPRDWELAMEPDARPLLLGARHARIRIVASTPSETPIAVAVSLPAVAFVPGQLTARPGGGDSHPVPLRESGLTRDISLTLTLDPDANLALDFAPATPCPDLDKPLYALRALRTRRLPERRSAPQD